MSLFTIQFVVCRSISFLALFHPGQLRFILNNTYNPMLKVWDDKVNTIYKRNDQRSS